MSDSIHSDFFFEGWEGEETTWCFTDEKILLLFGSEEVNP